MFEKEAEFYAREKYSPKTDSFIIAVADDAFKDGAEFGYNKANEWHYVKDGLPKDNNVVLVFAPWDGILIKQYDLSRKRFGELYLDEVIAWKEIVLPELKEDE